MNSTESLKYKDDTDRCYGVAGMALAAFMMDYEKYIDSISIDRKDMESVEFTPEFFITVSEGISPKASWVHSLEQFQMITSMLISNVMCRSMVRNRHEVEMKMRNVMLGCLHDYACDCQLEDDEAEHLFDKHYELLNRAYHNAQMHTMAHRLVDELSSRRILHHYDLNELLSSNY